MQKVHAERHHVLTGIKATEGVALWQYATTELRANKVIMLAAVKQSGLLLRHAPIELRRDRQLVLAAVNQNDLAIHYVEDRKLRHRIEVTQQRFGTFQVVALMMFVLGTCLNLYLPKDSSALSNATWTANGSGAVLTGEGLTVFILRNGLPASPELDDLIEQGAYIDLLYTIAVTIFAVPFAAIAILVALLVKHLALAVLKTLHAVLNGFVVLLFRDAKSDEREARRDAEPTTATLTKTGAAIQQEIDEKQEEAQEALKEEATTTVEDNILQSAFNEPEDDLQDLWQEDMSQRSFFLLVHLALVLMGAREYAIVEPPLSDVDDPTARFPAANVYYAMLMLYKPISLSAFQLLMALTGAASGSEALETNLLHSTVSLIAMLALVSWFVIVLPLAPLLFFYIFVTLTYVLPYALCGSELFTDVFLPAFQRLLTRTNKRLVPVVDEMRTYDPQLDNIARKARISSSLFMFMLAAAFAHRYRGGEGNYWLLHEQLLEAVSIAWSFPSFRLVFAFPELPEWPSIIMAISVGAFSLEKVQTIYAVLYRHQLHSMGRTAASAVAQVQARPFRFLGGLGQMWSAWKTRLRMQEEIRERDSFLESGTDLANASDEIRADKEVVLAVVKKNNDAFAHASAALRVDKDIRRAAGKSWAADEFRKAVRRSSLILELDDPSLNA